MASSSHQRTIESLKAVCAARNIRTDKVLVMTVQRDRTGEFFSLVADFTRDQLLDVYPAEFLTAYKELRIGDLNVCYNDSLPPLEATTKPAAASDAATIFLKPPFCCGGIQLYRDRPISMDSVFRDLVAGHGHHPNVVYEVKRQINNGAMLHTKYFLAHQQPAGGAHGRPLHRQDARLQELQVPHARPVLWGRPVPCIRARQRRGVVHIQLPPHAPERVCAREPATDGGVL